MFDHLLLCLVALALDVLTSIRVRLDEKELQIALLRLQIRILEHKAKTKPPLSRPQKPMLIAPAIHCTS